MFLNCSTYFQRHTAHHQELKNSNYSLWFYIRLWLSAAVMAEWACPLSHDSCRQPQTYVKPEAVMTVFELLMMSGVSLETCWAIKKHRNNIFYYTVANFGYFYKPHFRLVLSTRYISIYTFYVRRKTEIIMLNIRPHHTTLVAWDLCASAVVDSCSTH